MATTSTSGTGTLVTQPAFASQMTASPSPVGTSGTAIQKGYMIWDQPQTTLYSGGGPLGDGRDVINFLFNPSTVSTDYNVADTSAQAAKLNQVPGDSGNLAVPLYQTVSWQLYFDRTFELLYGGDATSQNDPGVIGVQADVYQFMQFTGVLAQGSGSSTTGSVASVSSGLAGMVSANPVPSPVSTAPSTSGGGIMQLIPCWVYFGNASQQYANSGSTSANNAAIAQQMAFYGYINEWSVQYTHWTQNMVPIRAAISVYFTMMPTPSTGGASSTWSDIQKLNGVNVAPSPLTNKGAAARGSGFPGIS